MNSSRLNVAMHSEKNGITFGVVYEQMTRGNCFVNLVNTGQSIFVDIPGCKIGMLPTAGL